MVSQGGKQVIKFASAGNRGSLFLIGRGASEIYFNDSEALPTILVKTFGTLCVLGDENVIQVDPPPPLNSVGCYKSNTFYISCTLYGPQLCLGGWGKNLVKAVFMSVYRKLAANSIQNQVKKGRCPKPFGQDCRSG